jgi:hypothetical protein
MGTSIELLSVLITLNQNSLDSTRAIAHFDRPQFLEFTPKPSRQLEKGDKISTDPSNKITE